MPSILVILFLCVGSLLAAGPECKDKKVSPEIRQQILDFHKQRREGKAVEWDCGLEDKARGILKTGKSGKIDTSKVSKNRGVNVREFRKEFEDAKTFVDRALRHWWSSDLNSKKNMANPQNKKIGCSYKEDDVFFLVACFYEK
ncbi:hypothetical protein Y032_0010g1063 [Ancylostoma ceylanicum]|uniref:SCP domain-containing protein n=1 Tax=Ancylostoma ceylanicum TaxID=53326 RepID=A0A016VFT0_9BILA|nr:hypothetical protein Y032_0010g1063 [Ancylostoma ceylanicum]